MTILVFIDQFESGGAARVTSTMLNGLIDNGYKITLATNITNRSIGYPLDKRIKTINFYGGETCNKLQSLFRHLKLINSAKNCIKQIKPDITIAITHYPYLYVRIASWLSGIPVIAVDHTSFSRKISWLEDWIRNYFYKYADVLSILTKKDEGLLGTRLPNKVVIYNPLSFPPLKTKTIRNKNILVAGRLSFWKVKGIDRIIDIWAKISDKYPDWILEIAGEGNSKSTHYLHYLVSQKGLDKRVKFLGQLHDMKTKLAETSIFALPSRVEGFPMVLMEAMSQGCACVAFKLGGASDEMMTNNKSGYIVEDGNMDVFSDSLCKLIDNPSLREQLGSNAINESKRFSVESFIQSWINILNKYENN